MTQPNDPPASNILPSKPSDIIATATRINDVLKEYSDKDWNYSRISLTVMPLDKLNGPYSLWIDFMETNTKRGLDDFQTYSRELSWGGRHSDELGILELISLRLNRALLEVSNNEMWNYKRPVVRLVKKEELASQSIINAIWYNVEEVVGEDFDNR